MAKVTLIYDPIYLQHDTGNHVENARRLEEVMSLLERTGLLGKTTIIAPRAAGQEELLRVHSQRHISLVRAFAESGGGWLDADTYMSPASYEVALFAAGGVIMAVDAVLAGEAEYAFALVRPPGHHATPTSAMGFCLFNNIAIAARHALIKHKLPRVLIVDFDVHHGNGTQETFYNDPRVLYFSTHQYPLYPGTGVIQEIGEGPGYGYTINVPLPAGCGGLEYERVFNKVLVPAARRFGPQLILVSAGYDAHWGDPIASMRLSGAGFVTMVKTLKDLSEELCQNRLVLALEGGYNLEALSYSVANTLNTLLGEAQLADPLGKPRPGATTPDIEPLLQRLKELHRLS